MSNELSTPRILICPADRAKTAADHFGSGFGDKNVSYFLGTDAETFSVRTYPQMFVCGDRNLALQNRPIKPGLFVLTTNATSLGWARGLHYPRGHILLPGCSVQDFDVKQLAAALRNQGVATNRLVIP